jgi:hypothetical protein
MSAVRAEQRQGQLIAEIYDADEAPRATVTGELAVYLVANSLAHARTDGQGPELN